MCTLGVCPHCGGPLEEGDDLEALRTLAGELGIVDDLDGTVSAMDAAGCSVERGRRDRVEAMALRSEQRLSGRAHEIRDGAA